MKTGNVVRKIRLNKKIHSKDLYQGLLSRPAIAKFERGESDTSVEKFLKMLDRLNITLEEFEILYNNEENKDIYYTRKYIEAFYNRDVTTLKNIAGQLEKEFELTSNKKFQHYKSLVLLLTDDLQGTKEHIEELKILQDYLIKCESWGYYEITLFANSLSFYSLELIDIVYSRAKKTLLLYQNRTRYRNEVALMLFNILEKKLLCMDIKGSNYYMNELGNLKVSVVDNMYMQTMIKYFSSIIALINGDYSKEKEILQILEIFNLLGLNLKFTQCRDFYEKIIKIYNLSDRMNITSIIN